jgi:hypothetical protein
MTRPIKTDAEPVAAATDVDGVDRIFEAAELREPAGQLFAPRSGRRIALASDGAEDRLVVRAPDGTVELTIRLTADGPVLVVSGAALELAATRDVTIECERFSVRARGEAEVVADGSVRVEGHAARVEARRGNVEIQANDDVVVDGERIYLNR